MSEPIRNLHPRQVHVVAWVGAPDTRLRTYSVYPEGERERAVMVEAHGILDAMAMGVDIFPDESPLCAREAE